MNFELVIKRVVGALETEGIRYALIGDFAMALRGVQRATMDLDFILMLEDMRKADELLIGLGYQCIHQTPNVSQYRSSDADWGEDRYPACVSWPHVGHVETGGGDAGPARAHHPRGAD